MIIDGTTGDHFLLDADRDAHPTSPELPAK